MNLIIYHQVKPGIDCPDGIAAAWVASRVYPQAKVVGAVYQQEIEAEIKPESEILIVDFFPEVSVLKKWEQNGSKVTILDHHKTAFERFDSTSFSGSITASFDFQESGATLTWCTFHPDSPVPALLQFVRSRDLWLDCDLFADPIPPTLIIHEALAAFRHAARGDKETIFEYYDSLSTKTDKELLEILSPVGLDLLNKKRHEIQELAQRAKWEKFLDGSTVPVIQIADNARLASDVCNYLLKLNPAAEFVAADTGESWALRSLATGADVSKIAERFGGGGHRCAAGFRRSND